MESFSSSANGSLLPDVDFQRSLLHPDLLMGEDDHASSNSSFPNPTSTIELEGFMQSGVLSSSASSKPSAAVIREQEYRNGYHDLQRLWNSRDESSFANLKEYLKNQSIIYLHAVMEKNGIRHSGVKFDECCAEILSKWSAKVRLPAPNDPSTPKKKRGFSETKVTLATGSSTAKTISETAVEPAAKRSLNLDVNQCETAVVPNNPPIGSCNLLGNNASASLLEQQLSLRDLVRSLVRLDDFRNEVSIPECDVEPLQRAIQALPGAFPPADPRCIPAQVLLSICIAILQQDHQRKFPEALSTLSGAHKLMTALAEEEATVLNEPLCQALFAQLEVRMGSAYRVNGQFSEALKMCLAAHTRARKNFLGTRLFRNLRASISCLLCSAYRCQQALEDTAKAAYYLEEAEKYGNEALLLYEGLEYHDQDAFQWAASELIKVFYAKGKPAQVEELRNRLCKPKPGESAECCKLMLNRLSFEGIKECLKLSHADTATLYAEAFDFIAVAIQIASQAEVKSHGPRCCCAIQAKHLRKAKQWLTNALRSNFSDGPVP